ncbi:MAG: hypothetical protein Q8908_11680 [Bacteroidota bacterium]|nr:hypothetical protein [Bacteroidota bacterium]
MKKVVKRSSVPILLTALVLYMTINVTKATPSTIIWIPSVDFQGFKSWHLGMDTYTRMQKTDGVRGAGIFDLGLTTGILPCKNFQAEVGVDYLSMGDNVYDDHPIYFNGKVGFPEGGLFKNSPAIAIGAYNVGLKNNLTNYNIVYGVIGKTLPVVGRLSAGYYTGNKRLLVDESGSKVNSGVMLSWDRTMTEISDKLWLAVDYQSNKNYLGALNFGLSWSFSKNVSMIFGYDIYNNQKAYYNSANVNANTFTAQLDINI